MNLALTVLLTIVASWLLLRPFVVNESKALVTPAGDAERQQKERVLVALEDLEREFQTGTIDQETYNLSRQELIEQASRLLQQIEQGSDTDGDSSRTVGQ